MTPKIKEFSLQIIFIRSFGKHSNFRIATTSRKQLSWATTNSKPQNFPVKSLQLEPLVNDHLS